MVNSMRYRLKIACMLLLVALAVPSLSVAGVLDHVVLDIDGNEVDLRDYKGQVVMIVNVASKSALTFHYEELERLYRLFSSQGFTVLAFPANNFANHEPGTNEEIKEFCAAKYGVTFPMFSKISVKGEDRAELYRDLTSEEGSGVFAGEILWNFTKFLINREGEVVARLEPRVRPFAGWVQDEIQTELKRGSEEEPPAEE